MAQTISRPQCLSVAISPKEDLGPRVYRINFNATQASCERGTCCYGSQFTHIDDNFIRCSIQAFTIPNGRRVASPNVIQSRSS